MDLPHRITHAGDLHEPIRRFCGSHDHILEGLRALQGLPKLALALEQARATAAAVLHLFDTVVSSHHAEEEQELFVAVLRSCSGEVEAVRVRKLIDRLKSEHRQIEAMWARLRKAVVQTAAGRVHATPEFDDGIIELVDLYFEHARLEEEMFLPLADGILARNSNHLAALDVALHLRHVPLPRSPYI